MQNSNHSGELSPQHLLGLSVEKLEIGPRGTFFMGFGFLNWLDFAQTSDLLGKLDLGELSCTFRCSVMCHAHLITYMGLCIFFSVAAGKNQRIVKRD